MLEKAIAYKKLLHLSVLLLCQSLAKTLGLPFYFNFVHNSVQSVMNANFEIKANNAVKDIFKDILGNDKKIKDIIKW